MTGGGGPPPPPPPDDDCALITFTLASGSVPFTEVQLTVHEKSSGETFGPFPVTIGETQSVPPGKYQFSFFAPAGYKVTPAERGVNLACGDDVTVKLSFKAKSLKSAKSAKSAKSEKSAKVKSAKVKSVKSAKSTKPKN